MADSSDRQVVWVRAVLGYLCLLAVFSLFLICVHFSLQEKRYRYVMAELLTEKLQQQREVSVARARVENLMRLERLEALCRDGQLSLGPPDLPALVLQLPYPEQVEERPDGSGSTRHGLEKQNSRVPDAIRSPAGDIASATRGVRNSLR